MKKLLVLFIMASIQLFAQEPVKMPVDTAKYELAFRQLIDAQAKTFYKSKPIEIIPAEVTIKATGQKFWIDELPNNVTETENPYTYSDQGRDNYIKQQEELKAKTK